MCALSATPSTSGGSTRSTRNGEGAPQVDRWPDARAYLPDRPDVSRRLAHRRVLHLEPDLLPPYGSRLSWIEAEFAAMRYFALNGTDYRSHGEQNAAIAAYTCWRNARPHRRRPSPPTHSSVFGLSTRRRRLEKSSTGSSGAEGHFSMAATITASRVSKAATSTSPVPYSCHSSTSWSFRSPKSLILSARVRPSSEGSRPQVPNGSQPRPR